MFIQARQAAQIDMMMYIHMYRCVYIEIYIYYVLCLYLYPYVCIDTCMLYSVQICMHPYVCMRGRQIIDYRPKNPRRMTRWRLQMQHCDESSSPECSNPLTGTPLFGKQFITLPKTGRANAPVKERKTGLPVPSILGVPFFCLRDDKFSRKNRSGDHPRGLLWCKSKTCIDIPHDFSSWCRKPVIFLLGQTCHPQLVSRISQPSTVSRFFLVDTKNPLEVLMLGQRVWSLSLVGWFLQMTFIGNPPVFLQSLRSENHGYEESR